MLNDNGKISQIKQNVLERNIFPFLWRIWYKKFYEVAKIDQFCSILFTLVARTTKKLGTSKEDNLV